MWMNSNNLQNSHFIRVIYFYATFCLTCCRAICRLPPGGGGHGGAHFSGGGMVVGISTIARTSAVVGATQVGDRRAPVRLGGRIPAATT